MMCSPKVGCSNVPRQSAANHPIADVRNVRLLECSSAPSDAATPQSLGGSELWRLAVSRTARQEASDGDRCAAIPVLGRTNFNDLNALKNNQRHQRARARTARTIEPVSVAEEGAWYRPEAAMEMEPSGAAWAWRSGRGGRRGSEGSKVRRGRWRDRRDDGAGSSNRPVPGSVGVADGLFRATLILLARGETSIGMKQALNRRPSRRTVSRSGRV